MNFAVLFQITNLYSGAESIYHNNLRINEDNKRGKDYHSDLVNELFLSIDEEE